MKRLAKPRMAITIGDAAGIGPEIALKALQHNEVYRSCQPVLIGDLNILSLCLEKFQLPVELNPISMMSQAVSIPGVIDLFHVDIINREGFQFGAGDAMTGRAMIEYTKLAVDLALKSEVDVVIGGPHTKSAAVKAGIFFEGYPSLVSSLTGTKEEEAFLMLVSDQLRVVNATLHVSLRKALELITYPLILKAIQATHHAGRMLGLDRPKIAVAGLNPHAGEGGLFGAEEQEVIIPAIVQAQMDGLDVQGPFASDTLFANIGNFDMYLAMYHDQAHIPMKMKAFKHIAAMTIGTPILFSSIGHGSAPDIAGKGVADPTGLLKTIELLSCVRSETRNFRNAMNEGR
ncbi:4-hydroxythreonine-4-phosphate dehydrogenase PdxA [Aneurinibacillus sp. Ricciae_BoGa-3]|uniref:PdxA family dehydrogenase n=1 Tax=Aneurinibacillus sp. Ricciae_BoGa-3 TaxID=3022697 RepID=UPI002340D42C|nr:4-hydroxythreonine-4-phosphate dehydrogenase PdxA [Aneurinibacillus sp. Ricciae_BoGa-3]WCK56670.1 4-hydroxythreonine-4-phosphate dehydrogenase PdxA [Aneurinibacillus sp. Ricciae_BoGa-3]